VICPSDVSGFLESRRAPVGIALARVYRLFEATI
jgi:hypothetical protein